VTGIADSAGRAAGGEGESTFGPRASLLVAVEPLGGSATGAGAALRTEGGRVAHILGVEVRVVTWPAGADLDLEVLADTLAALAARTCPAAVLLADTDTGRRLAPMVAHRLGSGAVVGCSDVAVKKAPQAGAPLGSPRAEAGGVMSFVKPVYGGWLQREVIPAAGTIPVVTLLLDGVEESASSYDGPTAADVLDVPPPAGAPRVRRLEMIPPDARSVDLIHARRIVGAGSGIATEGLLSAVGELAELLEGSVGATRPVVDDGHLPKERLIGQTGRAVTPDLYLALGISGSPHHVAGVRKAGRILSINRDAWAPIFQFSDAGYVADLEAVLPALVRTIKEWRDAAWSQYEPH